MLGRAASARGNALDAPVDGGSAAAAEEVALRILTAAAQSASGLQLRLQRRGFNEEAASAATAAMVQLGYVDDAALADAIAARRRRTGHGRIRVAAELRARGVADDAIATTLGEVGGDDEKATALEVGRRLAGRSSRDIADGQGRQRLRGALQRRGFDGETVGWVLRQLEREG